MGEEAKATRQAAIVLDPEQEEFLQAEWEANKKVTSTVLREKMDARFAGREELHLI